MTKKLTPIHIDLNDPDARAAADQAMNEAADRGDAFLKAVEGGALSGLGLDLATLKEFQSKAAAMRTRFKP